MSLLIGAAVFALGLAVSTVWTLATERLARRHTGRVADTQASDLAPDNDTGPDLRPLGEHPETPGRPGPLAADPQAVEDLLTGALRLLRAEADDDSWRTVAE